MRPHITRCTTSISPPISVFTTTGGIAGWGPIMQLTLKLSGKWRLHNWTIVSFPRPLPSQFHLMCPTYALFKEVHMKQKQFNLNLYKGSRGGRRPGSGRKRIHSKGVAHREREKVSGRTPLHINFKFRTQIRNKLCLRLLKKAILNSRSHGLRVIHFSLQHNHVHLIVEAESNSVLTSGMRSLTVTFAKGLKLGKV